jgi:hypothetical protein
VHLTPEHVAQTPRNGRFASPHPPVLHTAVPNWQAGDTIPLGADRMLCVIETRFVDDDPALVARLT